MHHSPILSMKESAQFCRIGISTVKRLINAGQFVPKIQISPRRIGFFKSDLEAWLDSRITKPQEK